MIFLLFFFSPSVSQSGCVAVCLCACVGSLAAHWLLTGCSLLYVHGAAQSRKGACKRTRVYVYVMQNSFASHPNIKKKKKNRKGKNSQPGDHFEIPGAHLAKPGNWGVYISATERGKRPDAPLSGVHTEITHIAMGDRLVCLHCVCVCVCVGRG